MNAEEEPEDFNYPRDPKWAYDRTSHIGKLDKALDAAAGHGWVVVSMKDDWSTIYTR